MNNEEIELQDTARKWSLTHRNSQLAPTQKKNKQVIAENEREKGRERESTLVSVESEKMGFHRNLQTQKETEASADRRNKRRPR